ncbi:MAG: twin-arginine translocation signal domain-containing protein, partial [Betaproteobacteria bacterium]|nr:twin-arginine translocation signal domain-containing protein [Betaproteobacteria bacterium]
MTSRRDFFRLASIAGGAVAASAVSRVALAALPEPVIQTSP